MFRTASSSLLVRLSGNFGVCASLLPGRVGKGCRPQSYLVARHLIEIVSFELSHSWSEMFFASLETRRCSIRLVWLNCLGTFQCMHGFTHISTHAQAHIYLVMFSVNCMLMFPVVNGQSW